MNKLDFLGRHAVVTGGAAGLGYAIAQRLIASKGTVTLWDLDEAMGKRASAKLGPAASFVCVDVASLDSIRAGVAATLGMATQISALVNSAGITGPNVKV